MNPRYLTAAQWTDLVLDAGSFVSWDAPPDRSGSSTVDSDHAVALARAAERTGSDEAVRTGAGRVAGQAVAVVVSEFGFLGGSIGVAAGRRLVAAIRRATELGLPLLAAPASGGTRMQEGTPAFVGMVDIVRAVAAHRKAGLPYLVYLRHPTTGGVLASWASLGQVTVAEPGALIGFLGPRVHEVLSGGPFPAGVQLAEHLVEQGVLDAVVAPADLRGEVARVLDLLLDRVRPATEAAPDDPPDAGADTWDSVVRTRRPDRPGVRDLLRHAEPVRLRGTGDGDRDESTVLALARLDGLSCVLVGQDRARQPPGPGAGALRLVRRGIRLATELRLPLVTVIDTPGAPLTIDGERRGLAGEIARTIEAMTDLAAGAVPSLAVLLGQGAGGAALALLPATRVLAARHAWLAPLPPEGASAITHHDATHAPELAERQHIGAAALQAAGIVHRVVPERPDAADEPGPFLHRLLAAIGAELRAQLPTPPGRTDGRTP